MPKRDIDGFIKENNIVIDPHTEQIQQKILSFLQM